MKNLNYFVSYAHKNDVLVNDFLEKFSDHAGMSKDYKFIKWQDTDIVLGEGWKGQIQDAASNCDFGLLLLSSSFFNRKYIIEQELPHFIKDGVILKNFIPVGIESFDFSNNLLGLEEVQIYRYQKSLGEDLKFYSELRGENKQKFVIDLLRKIHKKLNK